MTGLHQDGHFVSDLPGMARAAFDHFTATIGSQSTRDHALNLRLFDQRCFDLLPLDEPFSEDEIWNAIKAHAAWQGAGTGRLHGGIPTLVLGHRQR